MATLTWFGSVTNPRCFFCQLFVGFLSISDRGQERTVDRITYLHSLPRKHGRPHCLEGSIWPPHNTLISLQQDPQNWQPQSGFLQRWRPSNSQLLLSKEHLLQQFFDTPFRHPPNKPFLSSPASPCLGTPKGLS